ncbi:MAG: T9SS type B sorting domain-containing protein [Flavobacterium sp.]|uniref:Ig-like domain-containing protein n=1 Tax=Flavobacterium sp. TaxID=239 RepID=UPI00121F1F86|nr:gliding motility-associated C-terminal domain-containing protein [Flavobacterium sp.]RZJ65902.1 MAG: T9SS type B sorting domain-containing protein [Flavobacterium sp.]
MKLNFTFKRMYEFKYILVFLLPILFLNTTYSQSVRVYTETISSQANTDNAPLAVDENLVTRANVRASSGLALGIGAYSGHVELQYDTTLPANTTSYVKIQTDDNLLPALLGGSLGGVLADVLGTVLIGNQEFTVQAKNNATVVLQGDSQDIGEFAQNRLRIVTDENGDFFIAITPAQAYNRIRLTSRLGSLVGLFNVRTLYVYDAFYISQADNCGQPSYTSFSGNGITLDLINLAGAGVDNPENVLDASTTNFSQLSLGILGVAASIEQTVYFDGVSNANDQFNVRLRLNPSLVEVGVLNSIQLVASNGPNVVQTISVGSLLNAELLNLLQGNQIATIPFQTSAPANRITVRYNSLLGVNLNQTLDLYDITRVPRIPVITDPFTLNPRICAGNAASLVATTAANYELHWYATATSTTPLAVTQSGAPFTTPVLTADTSFFVSAVRVGCPEESLRVRINVDVISLPTAADITIASPQTACQGNVTLTPSSSIGGAVIRYYTSQSMTTEITTGYSGTPGATYVKNPTTGALTITGLTAANSPYTYYIALQVEGLCTNVSGTLKEVVVNYSDQLTLQVQANISGCGSVNLVDAITNFDASNTYLFFDSNNNPITAEAAANITANGTFFIQAQSNNGACSSTVQQVVVTIVAQPTLTLAANALVTNVGNSVTLNATSNGTITWYDSDGNALAGNTAGPFTQTGIYTFTAVAVTGACSATASVTVTVLDPAQCPPLTQPDYATTQSWGSIITGGVSNAPNAVDGNVQTFSTITTGIGLLGVGTTWQTLQWEETIAAGTPVTIKLGSEYSGLTLIGGFSVVGTKRNGSGVPQTIGAFQPVSGSLVDLLPGENAFEFTFVPSNGSGPQDYDGVRVMIGSTVSLAQNAKVFEAYYTTSATQVACGDDVRDVLFGAVDLGVGALTATVGVDDPFEAVDNSQTSSATMYSGLGVLAAAELTVVFNTPSIEGDQVRIRISKPGSLLSLSALAGISIQPMIGNAVSGTLVSTSLLSLQLLGGGESAILTFEPTATFDRLRIRFGGVAGVLEFLNIHDVERLADTQVEGADETNTITACQGQTLTLEADAVPCTTFVWYDAEVGGNVVATGNSFTLPADLSAGQHVFWIQPIRFGCSFLSRGSVTVNVVETAPEDGIENVTINGLAETSICSPDGNVTLLATLDTSITITNPVFYWYSFDGTTMTLVPNQSGPSLQLTGLAPGTYTYFVGFSSTEYCQTATADLTQVTFTILPSSVAADITVADAGICLDGTAVLTPTSTLPNPQFTFYFTNDTTQPITDGLTVGGVTYMIANGTLTITGLDETASPYTYYVAVVSDSTCINQAGQLAEATVTVGTLLPPTTNNATQNFCAANNPTIADLQVNETNVIFYDAATGGNQLPATTPLVAGATYYATLTDGVCESETRLAITVTIGNPLTPTTGDDSQNFCAANNPTFADIQVNESGVVFYNLPTGGTTFDLTAPLVAGTYYAAIVDGTCESETRFAITITISDLATPTTSNATQEFCAALNPTVADLDINEANVNVYDVATGGTPLAETTPLVTGTYYVTLVEAGTGCESGVRLEIAVNVSTVGTPTTNDATQDFCLVTSPMVADIQVNETGVIFYDAAVDGNAYDPATPLMTGTYYAALTGGACESDTRLEIAVTVNDPAPPTTSSMTQTFCSGDNPTVADLQFNEPNVIVYGIMVGTPLDPTSPLTAGVYYAANFENGCESSIRIEITVIITEPQVPTTNSATQNFCAANNPTVADLQVNETGVVFYSTPTGGTALDPATPLTAGTYYAAFGNITCDSGTRLEIAVTIGNPNTPTTNSATQNFCSIDAPTVADIQVNETGVIFYSTPTGGTAIDPSTPLTAGTYYAAISDGVCESGTRLEITITIGAPGTPTTNSATQTFCQSDNPTVADIQVNETGVIFYSTPTGGTPIAATTALTAGVYYAALSDGNCESGTRLEITVFISNPATPTTTDATQQFCFANNPTVADLDVNETNVVFYTTATGGTPLSATTALVTGTYYAALVEGDCESAVRLVIDVTVSGSDTAEITGGTDSSCISETVTYSTAAGMQNYVWTVTGGTITAGGTSTDNTVTVQWTEVGTGTVSVSYTDANCGNTATATRNITITVCSDLTITKVVDIFNPGIEDEVTFTITVNNNGISNFTNIIVNEALPTGYTYISSTASAGVYSPITGLWIIPALTGNTSATLEIVVMVNATGNYMNTVTIDDSVPDDSIVLNNGAEAWVEPICLIVYNEFTPNGDGQNDTFRIDCIENYPNNTLQVHNRYGVMVYKTRGYMNNWDGTANQNSPINEDNKLPAGTYYYVLELNDGSGANKAGWLYIMR